MLCGWLVCAGLVGGAGCAAEKPGAEAVARPTAEVGPAGPAAGEAGASAVVWPRRMAVLGPVLLVPVQGAGVGSLGPVVDSAGKVVPSTLHRVGVKFDASTPPGAARWMARPGSWVSVAPERAAELPEGVWVWRLDLRGVAPGTELRSGGRVLPLDWLEPAEELGRRVLLTAAMAQPLEAEQADRLAAMIEPMLASPLERWRAEALLAASLRAGAVPRVTAGAGRGVVRVQRPSDLVVDELAEQTRQRWMAALARLAEVDPGLADQVAARMVGMVRFVLSDGVIELADRTVVAPVWPAVEGGPVALAEDLIDPRADRDRVLAAARSLLTMLPSQIVWTMDDAGAGGPARTARRASVGVANLNPQAAPVSASTGDRGAGDLQRLEAGSAMTVSVAMPAELSEPDVGVNVVVGAGSSMVRVQGRPLVVRPPGLQMGPLLPDWTMTSWLVGDPGIGAPGTVAGGCSTLLLRRQSAEGPAKWTLYVETRGGAVGADAAGDRVRLWLGPSGRPRAVLTVIGDGRVLEGRPGAETEAKERIIEHVRGADGWAAWVDLPAGAVEEGGVLRIGLERIDAAGSRSAWPRPMLPWQAEPGRAVIETAAWR